MMHCEACVYDRGPHADWCESFWAKTLRRLRATFERRVTNAPADAIVLVTPTEADAIRKILKYNRDTGDRYFGRRFKVEPLSSEKAVDELNAMIDRGQGKHRAMKVRQLIEQLQALPPDALDRDVVVDHYGYCGVNVYRVRLQDDGTVLIDTTAGKENTAP